MHLIDFFWGVLSLAGAAVPVYRLYDNVHRPGAPYLLCLVVVCALYPWAYISYPYTPFDQGLVMSLTTWIGPLYLLGTVSYLRARPPGWVWLRNGILLYGVAMSTFALSNPLHGRFSTFAAITPQEPLSTTGQVAHGVGMVTMGGVSIACIIAAVALIGFYYRRSRFQLSHLVALTLFPVAAGCAYLLQHEIKSLIADEVNPFILCTSAGLWVLTYSLLRNRFLELRPIARAQVLNLMPDAMFVVDHRGVVIDCNVHFAATLGGSMGDVIGSSLEGRLPAAVWSLWGERAAKRSLRLEIGQQARHCEIHLVALDQRGRDSDVVVLLRDVTEQTLAHEALQANQKELELLNRELARLSSTDTLTGLRNRRYFLEQLAQECERTARNSGCFALLSIDLDNFKVINDSYGHAGGDEALVQAARAMESQCRATDTLARVGGEEFMVLVLEVDEQELLAVGERFRLAIERAEVQLKGGERLRLTASVGGAVVGPHIGMQRALRQVDDALYAAKRSGRNRVVLGGATGSRKPTVAATSRYLPVSPRR